jgi:hypothetical protein
MSHTEQDQSAVELAFIAPVLVLLLLVIVARSYPPHTRVFRGYLRTEREI